ncbi:hypothetical protein [Rhizobium terrae]|uniref:hypothetical protein n=1 Tax=Rhizobium terrae TaxID=2171756 RepID=UPI0013C2E868|nr:hypothetical protein [Rhizobium terrae]
MRWLFIGILLILIGCVLSIIWLNDPGDSRLDGAGPPQEQQAPLTSPPGTP